jgi:hypothetical protein
MISLTSIIKKDEITPLLRKLEKSGSVVRKVAAHAAARCTQDHFKDLAESRHRPGLPFNFYADAARKTTGRVSGEDVIIAVDKIGIAQRYFGGTIKPASGKKYLAIPTKDSAGNVPADFGNQLFFFRSGRTGTAGLSIREGKGMRVMYWLKKSVTQEEDETVMPTADAYVNAITPEVDDQIERMTDV